MPESAEAPSAYVEAAMAREEAIRACGPAEDVLVTIVQVTPLQVDFVSTDTPEAVRTCLRGAMAQVAWPAASDPFTLRVSYDDGPLVLDEPLVLGALDREVIDATIKEHIVAIKDCYAAELAPAGVFAKQPKGKIVVKFTIGTDGSVTEAHVKSREWTVGRKPASSDDMEACMLDEFGTMRFPEPRGGGIVIVSYPFAFSPW